ncbi:MetQ/NlpA family ABC transporter substrate-binding protein [Nocardioides convexus]|uniref:MetQ/NlpA family ABC transporter substrate-binding protein n=1 Tax=Nocardioides convexus TaxID=2712224 RepID=UPI002418AEA5|nr:MetQ/NlpA family ABC transporter substrate-binding protein [Nocardioides convexus]
MSDQTPLIEAPKSRVPLIAGVVVVVLAIIGVVTFFAVRGGDDAPRATGGDKAPALSKDKPVKVVIGAVSASDPYWETLKERAKDAGIDLEIKDFADYAQANPALSQGETGRQPVPAPRLPRPVQRRERRRPGADRRDRDLPAGPLLQEVQGRRRHPRGLDRGGPRRRLQPGPRPAGPAVGRPGQAQGRRLGLLHHRRRRHRGLEGQGQGPPGRPHAYLAARRGRGHHQQRLRRGRRPEVLRRHRQGRPEGPQGAALRERLRGPRRGQGQRGAQEARRGLPDQQGRARRRQRGLGRHGAVPHHQPGRAPGQPGRGRDAAARHQEVISQ